MSKTLVVLVIILTCLVYVGCGSPRDAQREITLTTIADAREGEKVLIDLGKTGDSQGDTFVFDQPLLDDEGENLGNNSGYCVRTRPGEFSECQWTLTMSDGSISVAGREAEGGISSVPIVGGTGAYRGVSGELVTTPKPDGTFTQVLLLRFPVEFTGRP